MNNGFDYWEIWLSLFCFVIFFSRSYFKFQVNCITIVFSIIDVFGKCILIWYKYPKDKSNKCDLKDEINIISYQIISYHKVQWPRLQTPFPNKRQSVSLSIFLAFILVLYPCLCCCLLSSLCVGKSVLSSSHSTMQDPCMAQLARHPPCNIQPAQMHGMRNDILAAICCSVSS